ncbi:SMI1/KNR4 family protein [Streptomyces sp. CA-243310]|uniref:SMI1/KNR4 family protein n=1 Tax=Streptomyces sp. CA-243310 TaxID=3240056 RepID=UPI003D8A39AF
MKRSSVDSRISRISRIRSKLAKVPYQPQRSHSAGAWRHQFRVGSRLGSAQADAFESEHRIELPPAYRTFLVELGGSGAGPFYGLLPLEECRLFTMDRQPPDGTPRGFHHWYERWLDHMRDGKDNKALGLTSPATVATAPWGPRATARQTRSQAAGRRPQAAGD